ncbi:uncharacterized protein LOC116247869 isoform X2 [Nymphaea colorata]|uniref:uncharacterized protein LOC116247869 isoform X2 n=1 Tax=Nymphaea colorata TaxID=210225 RepID=UPI00214E4F35|nr:uncharacterized protein LOC116247869 isoform X2 [Nymphaea colorata]
MKILLFSKRKFAWVAFFSTHSAYMCNLSRGWTKDLEIEEGQEFNTAIEFFALSQLFPSKLSKEKRKTLAGPRRWFDGHGMCQIVFSKGTQGQELISQTHAIPLAARLMSSPGEQLAAVSLLLELSKNCLSLCEKIGSRPPAILLFITIKYYTTDSMVAEKANMTLNNLVKCPKNIKIMAENELLEPLLSNLIEVRGLAMSLDAEEVLGESDNLSDSGMFCFCTTLSFTSTSMKASLPRAAETLASDI